MRPESINLNDLSADISSCGIKWNILYFEELESTNSTALELARSGAPQGTVVLANGQRMGRGRLGRTWSSEPGKNLTFTALLRPEVAIQNIGLLPLLAGVAVQETVAAITGQSTVCKWPNDVLLEGGKVCGILCESTIVDGAITAVVVGIGLNVNQLEFPKDIPTSPVSLASTMKRAFNRTVVLAGVLTRLDRWYARFVGGEIESVLNAWRASSPMIGSTITVERDGIPVRGTALDVAADGSLIVAVGGQTVHIHAGDVSLHTDYAHASRH